MLQKNLKFESLDALTAHIEQQLQKRGHANNLNSSIANAGNASQERSQFAPDEDIYTYTDNYSEIGLPAARHHDHYRDHGQEHGSPDSYSPNSRNNFSDNFPDTSSVHDIVAHSRPSSAHHQHPYDPRPPPAHTSSASRPTSARPTREYSNNSAVLSRPVSAAQTSRVMFSPKRAKRKGTAAAQQRQSSAAARTGSAHSRVPRNGSVYSCAPLNTPNGMTVPIVTVTGQHWHVYDRPEADSGNHKGNSGRPASSGSRI